MSVCESPKAESRGANEGRFRGLVTLKAFCECGTHQVTARRSNMAGGAFEPKELTVGSS